MFDALAVLRVVVLVNAIGLNIYRRDNFEHPGLGLACLVLMAVWTAFVTVAYRRPGSRSWPVLGLDLAIAVALILSTAVVKGEDFRATIPGYWVMAALFAWSIRFRTPGGLTAGIVLAAADLSLRQELRQSDYGNAFLLVVGGTVVGYLVASLQQMAEQRDAAERAAAAAQERARLSRVVHDGVLQVLALVHRTGTEHGPAMAELARLAGEQEAELRRLVQLNEQSAVHTADSDTPQRDLAAALTALGDAGRVTVATPSGPVELPAAVVAELVRVVKACLDNVSRHVGRDAPAWVLVQDLGSAVEISVRDQGSGIPVGRLDEAAAQGRLGVSQSIRGRIVDLGGTADLQTGPTGTEWEFVVPRNPEERSHR